MRSTRFSTAGTGSTPDWFRECRTRPWTPTNGAVRLPCSTTSKGVNAIPIRKQPLLAHERGDERRGEARKAGFEFVAIDSRSRSGCAGADALRNLSAVSKGGCHASKWSRARACDHRAGRARAWRKRSSTECSGGRPFDRDHASAGVRITPCGEPRPGQ